MNGEEGRNSPVLSSILGGVSKIYGAGAALNGRLYDKGFSKTFSLPCPVVSVGNITVGGTGKTPMTLFLADSLKKKGFNPAILSRGYGGTLSKAGGVVSDGKCFHMDPAQSGDEPYLMASLLDGIPVCIGSDRARMGMYAFKRFSPDLFILDDGYQHRRLHRDLNLLLIDSAKPFGNGHIIPRGTLREPLSAIERADGFVLTRSADHALSLKRFREEWKKTCTDVDLDGIEVFCCDHMTSIRGIVPKGTGALIPCNVEDIRSEKVFAFSGIAKNMDFRKRLAEKGLRIGSYFDFSDHHSYSDEDLKMICSTAVSKECGILATTEKDYVRFQHMKPLTLDLAVMGVDLDFGNDQDRFIGFVVNRIFESRA
jgi:tetraacyldisaccharide 4'-kinase